MRDSIAAIVINYGTAELAVQAVESLLSRDHGGREVAVHLVDNASPGDDAEKLQTAYSVRGWKGRVTLWLERENHGFGRGNNVILQALAAQNSPPDKVFLLNPDAQLDNEAVDILAAVLDSNPLAGAAGACVLRPDRTPVTAAFRFPSVASEVARMISFGPFDRLLKHRLVPLPIDHPAGPVDWVSGASVMFRFSAIQGIGFFDPGFFLYYEEVDMMRRLHVAGWCVLYEPKALVVHEEGAATGQFSGRVGRKRDPDYLYQSWAHYFVRAFGRPRALTIAVMIWPAAGFNVLHRRLRGKMPDVPVRFFRDHWWNVIRPLILAGRS